MLGALHAAFSTVEPIVMLTGVGLCHIGGEAMKLMFGHGLFPEAAVQYVLPNAASVPTELLTVRVSGMSAEPVTVACVSPRFRYIVWRLDAVCCERPGPLGGVPAPEHAANAAATNSAMPPL